MNPNIYSIGPTPDWAERLEIDLDTNVSDGESPYDCILMDYQDRVGDQQCESYIHTVGQINDASQLEAASQMLTELGEESEHLVLHRFDIIRAGERIAALDSDAIEVYRRETELESHITNRRLTVDTSIDDLRIGDLIEVEKTIIERAGEHPVWVKHHFRMFALDWGYPVSQLRITIDNRSSHRLTLQHHRIDGGVWQDDIETVEPGTRYSQSYFDLEAIQIPETAPEWWWTNCMLVSRTQTWNQVSRYLYDYYTRAGSFDSGFDRAALEPIGLGDDIRGNVIRIVRFVQNEIRYRGRHHGIYSHTPRPPDEVLRRRAGDCKDKSNLLVALLRAIDVEANLALVATGFGKSLDRLQPSPQLFDHMIVRARVDDETRYFDATIKKQGGDFDHVTDLDFGYALNLTAAGEALAALPFHRQQPSYKVAFRLDLRDGKSGRGRLEVRREFHRGDADFVRQKFASTEKRQIAEESRDWVKNQIGCELVVEQPVAITRDDTEANVLVVEESYSIINLGRTHPRNQIEVDSSLYQHFPLPAGPDFPLQLHADGHMEFDLAVQYPHRPPPTATELKLSNRHFAYTDRVWLDGRVMHFATQITPHTDRVERGELEAYRLEAEKIWNRSRYLLPIKVGFGWSCGWIFLFAVIVFGLVMILFTD